MDGSGRSKRVETREFWEEAIRLWTEDGLSVGKFAVVKAWPSMLFIHGVVRYFRRARRPR